MFINLDYSQMPSLAPPPGITPNFIDPPTMAPTSRILTGLTLAIMYCFLTLRVYTRVWVTCNFGIEDCKFSPYTIPVRGTC